MLMFDYFRVRSYLALEVDGRLGKTKFLFHWPFFLKKEKPTETSLWLLVVELYEPE